MQFSKFVEKGMVFFILLINYLRHRIIKIFNMMGLSNFFTSAMSYLGEITYV